MLSTLEQLENDIERFRKNVVESNDLCEALTNVVVTIKDQREYMQQAIDLLERNLQALNEDYDSFVQELSNADFRRVFDLCVDTKKTLDETHDLCIETRSTLCKNYDALAQDLARLSIGQILDLCTDLRKTLIGRMNALVVGVLIVAILMLAHIVK